MTFSLYLREIRDKHALRSVDDERLSGDPGHR